MQGGGNKINKTVLIEYKHVDVYQEVQEVLTDVTFTIDEGEFVYVIGKVGSGKSSLIKTLYGELPIHSGEATVMEYDMSTLKRKHLPDLRRKLGVIFQDFQLLSDRTVHDNLAFVLKATGWKDKQEIEERINDVLEDVELKDYADRFPHELSGGEQQRVAIARAMLNNPKIIIADEPTGNLDPDTANHIISLLRQVTQSGTAVVMTTHNIPLLDEYPGIVYRCIDHQLEEITNDYNKMALAEEEEASAQQGVDYSTREDLSM